MIWPFLLFRVVASLELASWEHGAPVESVTWSPDGSMVAASGNDRIHVWSTTSQIQQFQDSDGEFGVIQWSPDGKYLAVFVDPNDGSWLIRVYDTSTWELAIPDINLLNLAPTLPPYDLVRYKALHFHPDSTLLAVGRYDSRV